MKIDNFIDKKIGAEITADNNAKSLKHISSGKLSASRLGDPLQWQILYVLGVPQKPIDEYVLRKFLRGNQIEEWLVSKIEAIETQKFVEYKNVVGYVDAVVETKDWDFWNGIIPLEVKSVSNAKFKRIEKQGADRGHKLQAGLYALAMGSNHFGVCYVATDDLRVQTYIYETAEIKDEVDSIIAKYDEARKNSIIPEFEAIEKWQGNVQYSKYPEWQQLTKDELVEKLKLTN